MPLLWFLLAEHQALRVSSTCQHTAVAALSSKHLPSTHYAHAFNTAFTAAAMLA